MWAVFRDKLKREVNGAASVSVSANTRPHQLRWGDREMGTAIISCVECSQVAGLIQKVGRDSSKSTVSSCSCPSCSCPSCSCLSCVRARVAIVIVDRHVLSVRKRCVRERIRKYWRHLKYRIAGNFREHKFSRIANKHARKKFRDFYFRDKVTISDHTPYNFPHGNGDPQRVFQRQNDSKTLARLSKRVGCCMSAKNCHAKGRELTPRIYSQLR